MRGLPARGPAGQGRQRARLWKRAGKGPNRAAARAGPGPVPGTGWGGRAPERPAGQVAAGRRTHPQNPWRERIPLRGWHRPVAYFPWSRTYSSDWTVSGGRSGDGQRAGSAQALG
jgi:hypothetical protein